MSMGYSNRVWRCPFFRWDKREEIHCEEGHTRVFRSQRELAAWAREHCGKESGWEACPTARALLCPKTDSEKSEKEAHTMERTERNVDKIKHLEKELGRWQKKAADQREELEQLRQREADAREGVRQTGRLLDGILCALAIDVGERATDPDTGEALGWRLVLSGFALEELEEKYEVHTRRDGEGRYVIGVAEK